MTSEDSKLPAERLIQLRQRLGLSQREMAKEFQVSSGAIAFWEKGSRPIPGPILKLMHLFRNSKGVTMKLIQLASYIETGLPEEVRDVLAEFPANSKPSPYSAIQKLFFEEFKSLPEDFFREWSATPFAVTSLGQVHKARLKSGEYVAVKIQHPDIERILQHQFKNIQFMTKLLSMFKKADHAVIDDIKERINSECDYEKEAYNQKRFRNIFEDDTKIIIPKVYSECSSKRILTTEYIPGLSFKEFLKKASPKQKSEAGIVIHRFLSRSAVQTGLLHADPHPGNVLFFDDKVVVLDFGRVVEYTGERFEIERRFLQAFLNDNLAMAKTMMIKMDSVENPEVFNFDELWIFLDRQQTHYMRNQNFKFTREHLGRLTLDARKFSGRNQLKMNKWFFWAFFISNSGFSLLADLEAEANWRTEIMRFLN